MQPTGGRPPDSALAFLDAYARKYLAAKFGSVNVDKLCGASGLPLLIRSAMQPYPGKVTYDVVTGRLVVTLVGDPMRRARYDRELGTRQLARK